LKREFFSLIRFECCLLFAWNHEMNIFILILLFFVLFFFFDFHFQSHMDEWYSDHVGVYHAENSDTPQSPNQRKNNNNNIKTYIYEREEIFSDILNFTQRTCVHSARDLTNNLQLLFHYAFPRILVVSTSFSHSISLY
jgi:hypothetical protein